MKLKVLSFGCVVSVTMCRLTFLLIHIYLPCMPPFIGSLFGDVCEQFTNPLYPIGILIVEVTADYYIILNGVLVGYVMCLLGVLVMMRFLEIMNG
jgi:hypothetical protein